MTMWDPFQVALNLWLEGGDPNHLLGAHPPRGGTTILTSSRRFSANPPGDETPVSVVIFWQLVEGNNKQILVLHKKRLEKHVEGPTSMENLKGIPPQNVSPHPGNKALLKDFEPPPFPSIPPFVSCPTRGSSKQVQQKGYFLFENEGYIH